MATLKQLCKSNYPKRVIFKYSNGYSITTYLDTKNYKQALKVVNTKSKESLNVIQKQFGNIKEIHKTYKILYNINK